MSHQSFQDASARRNRSNDKLELRDVFESGISVYKMDVFQVNE